MKALALLVMLLPATTFAGDDFTRILKQVETHYGKRHMKIPFLGMVTFASHLTRPLGASDFKLAVLNGNDDTGFHGIPDFHPGPEWQAFIRTTSHNGDGHTVMYARDEGKAIRTLMLVVDRNEAVVMQLRMDPARFGKFVSERSH